MIVTLCGCAVKMVTTLKEYGVRKEIVGEVDVIEE